MSREPPSMTHYDQVQELIGEWRAWCRERNKHVGPGDVVNEQTAADLLGLKLRQLQERRYAGTGPRHRQKGAPGSLHCYALRDLVRWHLRIPDDE